MAGPPSEASLHALVDKADDAVDKGRWARAADLYKRAIQLASALYPHSLVTVQLQYYQAIASLSQAKQPGLPVAEQRALHEEAWALVREGKEVVSRRHASDTLGFNKCRPDEVQYVTHRALSRIPAGADPARGPGVAALMASSHGVSVAVLLARLCLYRLHSVTLGEPLSPLAAPERGFAEQFVLRALDNLASTRGVTSPIVGEPDLVRAVQTLLSTLVMEPPFRAALEARRTSPGLVACLRTHGTFEKSAAYFQSVNARGDAAHAADVAEHGFLVCALPGCDKKEVTVREFKVCSACKAVAYCSAEHGALHWARGHKHECNDLKAAGAKPARAA